MIFLKTYLNGWATSRRLDQCVQPCPLCGDYEGDTLGHLAVCPALASGVARAVNARPPVDALQALGMVGGESL
eukprot:7223597-Karenia_brevis.AAC.1